MKLMAAIISASHKAVALLLIVATSIMILGCHKAKEKHIIVGLGDVRLGEKTFQEWFSSKTDFMFFDDIGWRATPKSLTRYSVYYRGGLSIWPPQSFQDHAKEYNRIKSETARLVEILSDKYSTCYLQKYHTREKPVSETEIGNLVGYARHIEGLTWQTIFSAEDGCRHISVFVLDSDSILYDVIVVAWDETLLDQSNNEKSEKERDAL